MNTEDWDHRPICKLIEMTQEARNVKIVIEYRLEAQFYDGRENTEFCCNPDGDMNKL